MLCCGMVWYVVVCYGIVVCCGMFNGVLVCYGRLCHVIFLFMLCYVIVCDVIVCLWYVMVCYKDVVQDKSSARAT
jgi:hypothetical protein